MNKFRYLLVLFPILFLSGSVSVFALGQVAGPVVIHVRAGESNTSIWGIFNQDPVTVSFSADGNASEFISFPEKITLEANNKISWINIVAAIPADYNYAQGKNITGAIYALSEGESGQVQLNLQLKKNIFIIVENSKTNEVSQNLLTGFVSLQPSSVIAAVIGLILLTGFFYFTKIRRWKRREE